MQKMILEKFLIKVEILRQGNNSFIGKIKIKGDIYVRKSYENYGCKNR